MYNNQEFLSNPIIGAATMLFGIFIILAILRGIGLFKMAKKCNLDHGWFAFVPLANAYLFGEIALESKKKATAFLCLELVYSIFPIINIINVAMSLLNGYTYNSSSNVFVSIFNWIYIIFSYFLTYKIYKKFSDKSTLMLIFSILTCGILKSIFIFAIRNNELNDFSK